MKMSVAEKRAAVIDEAIRRLRLMRRSDIETEFAAIENALEIRIRFIPEPTRRRTPVTSRLQRAPST